MTNKLAKIATLVAISLGIVAMTLATIYVLSLSEEQNTPLDPIPTVKATSSPPSKTYTLGDLILQTETDRYFFHGFTTGASIAYNVMVIGHQTLWEQGATWSSTYSAMADIYVHANSGDTITIQGHSFTVGSYGNDRVTLQG